MPDKVLTKKNDTEDRFFISNFGMLDAISRRFSLAYSMNLLRREDVLSSKQIRKDYDWLFHYSIRGSNKKRIPDFFSAQSTKSSINSNDTENEFIDGSQDNHEKNESEKIPENFDKNGRYQFSLQDVNKMHHSRLHTQATKVCIGEVKNFLLKAKSTSDDIIFRKKADIALKTLISQGLLFVQDMVKYPQNYRHILQHYEKNEFLQDCLYHKELYFSLIVKSVNYSKLLEESMPFSNEELSKYIATSVSSEDNTQKNKLLSMTEKEISVIKQEIAMIEEEIKDLFALGYPDDISELSADDDKYLDDESEFSSDDEKVKPPFFSHLSLPCIFSRHKIYPTLEKVPTEYSVKKSNVQKQ